MSRVAFVFSGQGAQKPGMGKELFENVPAAAELFQKLEAIRPGTMQQCFEGPAEVLNQTENTQPCLYAMELAAAAALTSKGVNCEAAAGFSLGELSALAFSGTASAETGFELVCRRAELMSKDSAENPGSMAAVLKLSAEQVEQICASLPDAWPVNYNCPGQIVVACVKDTMPLLTAAVRDAGGKALPLKVSGAFHSPLMQRSSKAFREVLAEIPFNAPRISLYSNLTGKPYEGDPTEALSKQICSPVRWQSIVEHLIAEGFDTFVELGPGKTLCGLIAKINPDVRTFHVEDCASLEEAVRGCTEC